MHLRKSEELSLDRLGTDCDTHGIVKDGHRVFRIKWSVAMRIKREPFPDKKRRNYIIRIAGVHLRRRYDEWYLTVDQVWYEPP